MSIIAGVLDVDSSDSVSTHDGSSQSPREFIISEDIFNENFLKAVFAEAISVDSVFRVGHSSDIPLALLSSLSAIFRRAHNIISKRSSFIRHIFIEAFRSHDGSSFSSKDNEVCKGEPVLELVEHIIDLELSDARRQSFVIRVIEVNASIGATHFR